jgi:hypothetical protein
MTSASFRCKPAARQPDFLDLWVTGRGRKQTIEAMEFMINLSLRPIVTSTSAVRWRRRMGFSKRKVHD